MRALILTCCALLPVNALAGTPVPKPKPAAVEEVPPPVVVVPPPAPVSGCPEGQGTPAQMWDMVGKLTGDSRVYEVGAVYTGKIAGEMMLAFSAVTGQPRKGATAIVVFSWNDGDQTWLTMTEKCAPAIILLKPPQIKAIAAVMRVQV